MIAKRPVLFAMSFDSCYSSPFLSPQLLFRHRLYQSDHGPTVQMDILVERFVNPLQVTPAATPSKRSQLGRIVSTEWQKQLVMNLRNALLGQSLGGLSTGSI